GKHNATATQHAAAEIDGTAVALPAERHGRPWPDPASPGRSRLCVFAVRTGDPEEVALPTVAGRLLVDEVEVPHIEGVEPVVPRHLGQAVAAVPGKVELEHAQMVV